MSRRKRRHLRSLSVSSASRSHSGWVLHQGILLTPVHFVSWQSGLPFQRYNLTLKIQGQRSGSRYPSQHSIQLTHFLFDIPLKASIFFRTQWVRLAAVKWGYIEYIYIYIYTYIHTYIYIYFQVTSAHITPLCMACMDYIRCMMQLEYILSKIMIQPMYLLLTKTCASNVGQDRGLH